MKMKLLLVQLSDGLNWDSLKHEDKEVAIAMEKLAPKFVAAALKLSKTRHIQAQSSAKRGKK